MSTPATYSFIGEAPAPAVTTLYVHLDGYAQGAANYFRAMLRAGEGVSAVARDERACAPGPPPAQ